jgi:hypothetical protein
MIPIKTVAQDRIGRAADSLIDLSHRIHGHPELAFQAENPVNLDPSEAPEIAQLSGGPAWEALSAAARNASARSMPAPTVGSMAGLAGIQVVCCGHTRGTRSATRMPASATREGRSR